ncbi:putative F-box-like domain superfamily protein [Arabidopsis thaliana]
MMEILIRLPAKSLMKFKYVSKLWVSLTRSRYLTNLYLTVTSPPQQSHRVYIRFVNRYLTNLYHYRLVRTTVLLSQRMEKDTTCLLIAA